MAKLRMLRLQARLSVSALAKEAQVDDGTVKRAESGTPIQDVKAYAIVEALGKKLGRKIEFEDVEDLRIL